MRRTLLFAAPVFSAALLFSPLLAHSAAPGPEVIQVAQKGHHGGGGGGGGGGARMGGGGGGAGAHVHSGRGGGSGFNAGGGGRTHVNRSNGGRMSRHNNDGGHVTVRPNRNSGNVVRRRGNDGKYYSYRGDRRHHRGTRFNWGPGAIFYFYDGYYHGDCAWLRRKAVATGSSYWWRRYRLCRAYD